MGILSDLRWLIQLVRGSKTQGRPPTNPAPGPPPDPPKPTHEAYRHHPDYRRKLSMISGVLTKIGGFLVLGVGITALFLDPEGKCYDVREELKPVYQTLGIWSGTLVCRVEWSYLVISFI